MRSQPYTHRTYRGEIPLWVRVVQACDGTRTKSEVARELGVTRDQVTAAAKRARTLHGATVQFRESPDEIRVRRSPLSYLLDRQEIRVGGGIVSMLQGLDDDAQRWLITQVPEGATLTDVIRAILVDVFSEEMGR